MNEKDLKKLNRKQLLELLLKQTQRADDLQKRINELEDELKNISTIQKEAGSIAEAALKLNGVFEAAEAAAAQYIESVKKSAENQDLVNKQMETEAKTQAAQIIEQANAISKKYADKLAACKNSEELQAVIDESRVDAEISNLNIRWVDDLPTDGLLSPYAAYYAWLKQMGYVDSE